MIYDNIFCYDFIVETICVYANQVEAEWLCFL